MSITIRVRLNPMALGHCIQNLPVTGESDYQTSNHLSSFSSSLNTSDFSEPAGPSSDFRTESALRRHLDSTELRLVCFTLKDLRDHLAYILNSY